MLLTALRPYQFSLDNFRGPLEFLHQLIQREELDIRDIPLQALAEQFMVHVRAWETADVDGGAEFIGTMASLALVKSRTLLPKREGDAIEEDDGALQLEIMQQLIEYCRIKEFARDLSVREERVSGSYPRGILIEETVPAKSLGLDHVTMAELAALFQEALRRAASPNRLIQKEQWRVSDKIRSLKERLSQSPVSFQDLFSHELVRPEIIVTFLALLELMKTGIVQVIREADTIMISERSKANVV